MKLSKISRALGLAALAAVASPYAVADDAGWYGGANVGQSRAKIDDARITSSLLGSGFGVSSINDDGRDLGYKLFGGYQFNRNFALEAGYFDLGSFGYRATTLPAASVNGSIRLRGLDLDVVGTLPITEKFSAFGRVGLAHAQARDSFSSTGAVQLQNTNPSKSETNYKFGVGLQYAFTEALAMRLEAERYRINDAVGNKGDVDLFSIGLIYRFGGKTPAPAPRAAEPEVVAYTPPPVVAPPAPPPAPPAPPAVPRKLSLSSDSLFDFDKAVVKPEGRQHLDKLATDLKGASYERITVTGHSDRIGPHDYNLKLSTRRAEAVKAYLVESAGIAAGKIEAIGKDGADPVTKPADCRGVKGNKLIACLQPDRRVDVEVTGTK